ncbi:hypothetical protein KAU11_08570 [Candidatus Babeliales bacterium]|nr:hypothetical protein [Candidatus Babeliales bacterium]
MKLEALFERTITDTQFKKIVDKEFLRTIGDFGDKHAEFFILYNPEYEDTDINKIHALPAFKEFMVDELRNQFDDTFDDIFRHIKGGKIILYREMTVRKDWVEHLAKHPKSRIGQYWSWDAAAAEAHWGNLNLGIATVVIEVQEKHVDWSETFQANLKAEEEKEITLFKNTPIKIKAILNKDDPVDISSLDGNWYKA